MSNTIRLTYQLEQVDFLNYQLFTASKSDRIRRKRWRGWGLLTGGCLVLSVFYYVRQNNFLAIYFGLVTLLSMGFYPLYFKWRYKKHYQGYIKENYKNKLGVTSNMEITSDAIMTSDETGEGKFKMSAVEEVNNLQEYLFVKMSTNVSLILPKQRIENIDQVLHQFQALGIKINDELNWKW